MPEFANSLPRSVWNTPMSVSGNLSVAKAAFTSRASFLSPAACPQDLAVVQVDQQADVVPLAADADVREVADYVGAREVAVELPVEHVGASASFTLAA